MSHFAKLKFIAFLFVLQFILIPVTLAANIKTTNMDSQDTALIANSGLAGNSSLSNIIAVLIKTVLGFLGVVFLVLIILAGFKWMTSEGNEEEIKKAKASLKSAIIGLVIVLSAYVITYSVFNYLPFASNGGGSGAITTTP